MNEAPRTVHRAADGTPILTYIAGSAPDHPAAYAIEVVGPGAADAILADMSGWTVSCPEELASPLVRAGATVRRHFHMLRRELVSDPPPPDWSSSDLGPGRREIPCDRDARDVFGAWHAAYSTPGHPDRHLGSDHELLTERLIPLLNGSGGVVQPWSRLVVDTEDHVVAGVVAIEFDTVGPLIADVFRSPGPDKAGLGTALLRRVLAAAARGQVGEVRLAVTDGNPARAVYERLGFRSVRSMVSLVVP